jgi:beta-glucosidase
VTDRRPLQWGAAFGAVQSEGAALASDWFEWERRGEAPPSFDGNGFATDFADDLRLLAGTGADGVRLTLDWSRLEPAAARPDDAVFDRYRSVLESARDAGLQRWVVLADGPLPGWFSVDERGWRDRSARSTWWPRHVERVADRLGDLVDSWIPVLRPVTFARGAFVTGSAPPGTRSLQRFVETVQGAYLASFMAWRVLRGGPPVALGVEAATVRAAEEGGERPAELYDTVLWAWVEGVRDGVLSLPRLAQQQVDAMRDAFDAVAVTFDGSVAATADGSVRRLHQPDELASMLHRLAETSPDLPIWLAGHTVSHGDPAADAEAAERACAELDAVRADGIALERWVWEPAVDGYEGSAGFGASLGLFDRDRRPKPAAAVLQRWSAKGSARAVEQGGDERGDR